MIEKNLERSKLTPKNVSESAIEKYKYIVSVADLNDRETLFGGRVLEMCDRLAGKVAKIHSGKTCVTVSLDSASFLNPSKEGEYLIFKSSVNRAWTTSMEIGIKVVTEPQKRDNERHIVSMYFTYVAIDNNNKPTPVPQAIPQTQDQIRRFKEAGKRRAYRLRKRKKC